MIYTIIVVGMGIIVTGFLIVGFLLQFLKKKNP